MRGRAGVPGLILVLGAAGCIRSVSELPDRPEGAILSGQVVSRGGVSGDWSPAPGVSVTVLGLGISTTTNEDGNFSLARLPVNHLLTVRLTAPRKEAEADRTRVLDPVRALQDGERIDLGTLRLGPGGALQGRALLQAGPDAAPIGAGGTLVVMTQTTFKAVTDDAGLYQLPDLPEGVFDLVAFQPGYLPGRVEGVAVVPGGALTVRDMVLQAGQPADVEVSGFARVQGAPSLDAGHEGITVRFEGEGTDVSVDGTTAADGRFTLSVAPGVYRVTASRDGLSPVVLYGVAVLPEAVLGLVEMFLSAPDSADFDRDGIPDSQDDDDDNDGCADEDDKFPKDPSACFDFDDDGIPDERDLDDDDDGLSDAEEITPGADGWVTNPRNPDTDNDGYDDLVDVCPTVYDDQTDSDGDGRGDACPEGASTGLTPVITGFTPMEAGPGATLDVFGRNFSPVSGLVYVRFGRTDGPAYPTFGNTNTSLRVTVPSEAQSGFLQVISEGRTATSAATFTFRPAPEVTSHAPPSGRRGSRVVVVGLHFEEDGLMAFVNGVQATLLPFDSGGLVEARVLNGQLYDVLQLEVPDTTTGPIEVRNRFGFGQGADPFVVTDAGVVIDLAAPNPVSAGAQLTLFGHGFSTEDQVNPSVPEVIFDYGGAEVRQPLSFGWTDTLASVTVPNGATSGLIALAHPAASDPIVYSDPLDVAPNIPYLVNADPQLVMPGDNLTLFGGNLQGVTRVTLGGGVTISGANLTTGPGSIQLTVPAGAQAGPVTVESPAGLGTSPFRVGTVVVSPPVLGSPSGVLLARGGVGPGGQEFFALSGSGANLTAFTATAAVPRVLRTISLPPVAPGETFTGLSVAPSGTVGLLQAVATTSFPRGRTYVVEIPSFQVIGICPIGSSGTGSETNHVFDPTTSAAFGRMTTLDGVLRIDLATGSCETLIPGDGVRAFLSLSSGALLVTDDATGAAVLVVDPQDPLYGTLTTPWTLPAISANHIFRGPGAALFVDNSSNNQLGVFEPFTGNPPSYLPVPGGAYSIADGAQRYFLSAGGSIVDMSTGSPRLVRSSLPGVSWAGEPTGAGIPGMHSFITRSGVRNVVRVDIQP